ncbi:MAG: KTSC domain-containing protein [Candidatus Thorarchaeota archaeon]|jgi:hypothetical protein
MIGNRSPVTKNIDIDSSLIESASWSKTQARNVTGELTINFHDGGSVSYSGVREKTVTGLRRANSAGGYYNRNIRGKFSHS